mgnify:FL=1
MMHIFLKLSRAIGFVTMPMYGCMFYHDAAGNELDNVKSNYFLLLGSTRFRLTKILCFSFASLTESRIVPNVSNKKNYLLIQDIYSNRVTYLAV